MKVFSKYFDSEWGVTKIKIDERFKTLAFDVKNHRLSIITHDRLIFNFDIPAVPTRYIDQADIRRFKSEYDYNAKPKEE
jgi:phytoene dehydrogenase-like protein